MTQPPNNPGDNQGGFPPPQDPQQPGVPPQQPGGYPPPQGAQGFPPPAGGYQPAPGGYGAPQVQPQYSVGDAFSWAWNKFTKNAWPLIGAMLAFAIIMAIVSSLVYWVFSLTVTNVQDVTYSDGTEGPTFDLTGWSYVVGIIGVAVIIYLALLIQASYTTGVLDIADGRKVTVGSFFKPRNFGSAAGAAILTTLAIYVGLIIFIVPGIVLAFFLAYSVLFAVDKNIGGGGALKASWNAVKSNAGNSILTTFLAGLVAAAGAVLCYIGALVTGPLGQLVQVYAYRTLTGGQVAPKTQ
ncbi:Integral membrane protein OS=Tsukamurella paurometabola (strain ATCC 8368 / DSM / CCUG 35730/ CIP 100753 / JCM 10117 / KCTC 9821 / NBRC 16120 / NCIMB 702349/ NCTC 13040) OX=521096 GN=Tpau_3258 PE=4 SV=1 [Tsukamurella paurometabola]|uniref:Integral membrane protein n=1 Tax=Tsukamurella paurometabola (strain ATCC 8368 / DSM 20162 / CCUG 35730 / CIP 100753 / JCM 10117 / KCTC 9821 / NBRC 16120 / NCIMB 702349 / NCTC 13040) TaxID=521096 RepID=D5UVR1_TSUPD|nr:hypothetical protein [Tsukamurella paurometabola]ADG79843.1 conserved hypothetical protein [Tsukamurella paurometabola DSM 20162]SUP37400.1 Predicted integral membrane protein [Tsukamurella paurometabola]